MSKPETPAADALPEDLDVTAYVGPYLFPDIRRRRIAAVLHAVVAALALLSGVASQNTGLLVGGSLIAVVAVYHWFAAWHLAIDQTAALAAASRAVGFPVGHASAQLGWRGLLSRPSWRILVYSADSPPTLRGLVEVDAVDASIVGEYTESNPEDWEQYGLDHTAGPTPA